MISSNVLIKSVIWAEDLWAAAAVIESLLYSMIDVNVLIDFWSFFIDLRESSVLVNDVACSIIFLLKLTVAIVVVFIVFELTILSLTVVYFRLLRVVRSVSAFISLVVWLFSSILIRLTIQILVCVFWCRLQQLMLTVSRGLQWNHSCISSSLLITIRQRVLIHRTKRKRALKLTLNRTV